MRQVFRFCFKITLKIIDVPCAMFWICRRHPYSSFSVGLKVILSSISAKQCSEIKTTRYNNFNCSLKLYYYFIISKIVIIRLHVTHLGSSLYHLRRRQQQQQHGLDLEYVRLSVYQLRYSRYILAHP